MYFDSRKKGKSGLPWFDARTEAEKSSDEYFEKLDDLAKQLDDIDADLRLYSSLIPEDFDSGYEYVYARIKELERYVAENESSDELNSVNTYMVRDSLDDINEELSDLYDSAILYDDYIGPDSNESDDDDYVLDFDDSDEPDDCDYSCDDRDWRYGDNDWNDDDDWDDNDNDWTANDDNYEW